MDLLDTYLYKMYLHKHRL